MPRFTAIPEIPLGGLTDWMYAVLSSLKENVELLTGTRGEPGGTSVALTKEAIRIDAAPEPTMTGVTATGEGFKIDKATVPSLDDYAKLIGDVQNLAIDVAALRATVNVLIGNLKA